METREAKEYGSITAAERAERESIEAANVERTIFVGLQVTDGVRVTALRAGCAEGDLRQEELWRVPFGNLLIVSASGPALAAGVVANDLVVAVRGMPVRTLGDFRAAMMSYVADVVASGGIAGEAATAGLQVILRRRASRGHSLEDLTVVIQPKFVEADSFAPGGRTVHHVTVRSRSRSPPVPTAASLMCARSNCVAHRSSVSPSLSHTHSRHMIPSPARFSAHAHAHASCDPAAARSVLRAAVAGHDSFDHKSPDHAQTVSRWLLRDPGGDNATVSAPWRESGQLARTSFDSHAANGNNGVLYVRTSPDAIPRLTDLPVPTEVIAGARDDLELEDAVWRWGNIVRSASRPSRGLEYRSRDGTSGAGSGKLFEIRRAFPPPGLNSRSEGGFSGRLGSGDSIPRSSVPREDVPEVPRNENDRQQSGDVTRATPTNSRLATGALGIQSKLATAAVQLSDLQSFVQDLNPATVTGSRILPSTVTNADLLPGAQVQPPSWIERTDPSERIGPPSVLTRKPSFLSAAARSAPPHALEQKRAASPDGTFTTSYNHVPGQEGGLDLAALSAAVATWTRDVTASEQDAW